MSAAIRVLVTGATGIVGSELLAQAEASGLDVTGVSARGDAGRKIAAWRMGVEPPPEDLRRPWDVIVHAAASTRWNLPPEEAHAANVETVAALRPLIAPSTRLVSLSTAHAVGHLGSTTSERLDDYRNTYEWSKAGAERYVRAEHPDATIVEFPIVLGRRSDGAIIRYAGFYKLLGALASGLVPAIVARPNAFLDLVPVDDVARTVLGVVAQGGPPASDPVVIGRGADALRVEAVLDLFFATIDEWRAEQGIEPLPRPPVLEPAKWERFFLPFARQHLSPLQLRTIDVFSEFQPYMCLEKPFDTNVFVDDVTVAMVRSLRRWADAKPQSASAIPEPWR